MHCSRIEEIDDNLTEKLIRVYMLAHVLKYIGLTSLVIIFHLCCSCCTQPPYVSLEITSFLDVGICDLCAFADYNYEHK